MRTGRSSVLVALAAVLALVGTACGVLPGGGTYEVKAEFRRTYNLFPGSPVRVLGINVGKIKDVEIDPGDESVTVTMLIDEDRSIPADASALVIPEALLGERYVQFEPPYTGGPALEDGATVPVSRTQVPFEFDEVLSGLNDFVGGLDEDEVGRFVTNLAETIDGQGEDLRQTIVQAEQAMGVLQENDDSLVSLAGRLADLNETLATRDQEIGDVIEAWNTVAGSLADDREQIDAALGGLLRLTRELGDVLVTHRETLQDDVETLTRVGRTLNRNLDQVSLAILSSAELFRHADRVVNRERNWLPLVNHASELANELTDTVTRRLEGLCLGAGLPPEQCESLPLDELLEGGQLCLPGVVPCTGPEGEARVPISDAVRRTVESSPELQEAVEQRREQQDDAADTGAAGDAADDVTDALGDATGITDGAPAARLHGFDALLYHATGGTR